MGNDDYIEAREELAVELGREPTKQEVRDQMLLMEQDRVERVVRRFRLEQENKRKFWRGY